MPHKPERRLLKGQTHIYIYSWINKGVIIGCKGRGQVTFKWRGPNQSRTICKEINFKSGLWSELRVPFPWKNSTAVDYCPQKPLIRSSASELQIMAASRCKSDLHRPGKKGMLCLTDIISNGNVCDSRGQSFSVSKKAVVIQRWGYNTWCCSRPWGEIPVHFKAGFTCICFFLLINDRADVHSASSFLLFHSSTSQTADSSKAQTISILFVCSLYKTEYSAEHITYTI